MFERTHRHTLCRAGLIAGGLTLLQAGTAAAATPDFAVLLTIPALVDQAILLVAIVSIVIALRVYTLVKGGLLAKSWQLFVVGMLCLAISQLFGLAGALGYLTPPEALRPGILLCMAALWMVGAVKARSALG